MGIIGFDSLSRRSRDVLSRLSAAPALDGTLLRGLVPRGVTLCGGDDVTYGGTWPASVDLTDSRHFAVAR